MARTTVPTKELREWEKRFRPGYELGEQDGAGHWQITGPDRELVRYSNGKPVTLASTPKSGGPHYQKRIAQLLESAGVINGEVTRPKRHYSAETIAARREQLRATLEPRRVARQAEAEALHAKLSPIVEKLGGWEIEGLPSDICQIAAGLASEIETHRAMTPDLLQGSLHRVRHHGWVTPDYQRVWGRFAEEFTDVDVIEHFYTLVRKARGLPTSPVSPRNVPSLGAEEWPFRVELVALKQLLVDHIYQRPVHWPFVRRLATSFDERLVGTLDVAQRRSRGETFAILDGQLRYEAMRLREKRTCWVAIYPQMGIEAEARFFLHKNRDRKMIHPFYIYRAELTAKEKEAVAIDAIMQASRYQLSSASGGDKKPALISAVAAVREAHNRTGNGSDTLFNRPECLSPTLHWLGKTMYGKPGGTNSVLIRGFSRFLAAYRDDELDLRVLEGVLAGAMPEYLLSRASAVTGLQGSSGKAGRLAVVIAQEYNDRPLAKEKRLNVKRLTGA